MMKAVIDLETDDVVGYAEQKAELSAGFGLADLPPEWDEKDRDHAFFADGKVVVSKKRKLNKAKHKRCLKIKEEAQSLIESMNWRVTRAKERHHLKLEGETLLFVYAEREAIRRASNRAEREVEKLPNIQAVRKYAWSVTEKDSRGLYQ